MVPCERCLNLGYGGGGLTSSTRLEWTEPRFYAERQADTINPLYLLNLKNNGTNEDCTHVFTHTAPAFACVQTSPISFSACNKGNRRRLHAGNTSLSSRELHASHSHCTMRKYYPNLNRGNDPGRAHIRNKVFIAVLFLS